MTVSKRFFMAAAGAAVVAVILLAVAVGRDRGSPWVKIGIPDDSSSILVSYAIRHQEIKAVIEPIMESYSIKDCCSSTAHWALSSGSVDLAVLCPDAARVLVAKDKRYQIVGPVLVNSDVVVVRNQEQPRKIGITQNRWYQKKIIRSLFGEECQVVPMLPEGLPYAYQKGHVDGVVLDVEKALQLPGTRISTRVNNQDLVTYVLVARRAFMHDPRFPRILQGFCKAAVALSNPETLQDALNSSAHNQVKGMEAGEWIRLKVRFVPPQISQNK
ncbi:MAG TPA: hypothetical protein GXX19_10965 [Syntrophomonadaceae bacterium]|nr:hypothetical protein [Syntrophomonadaceae bacterium]